MGCVPGYAPDFFKTLGRDAETSARRLVPMLMDLVRPNSVIDVGCGNGAWLAVFGEHGITDMLGVDGPWVPADQVRIRPSQLMRFDLTQPLQLDRRFDLALCLEVGEHLPAASARGFVQSLSRLAPVIAFSAAIPFQGGNKHVNEQWPDYWQALFAAQDYRLIDCLRALLWNDPLIQPFLAQNLMLYVDADYLARTPSLRAAQDRSGTLPLRVVHPGVFQIASVKRLLRMWRSHRSGG